MAKMTIEDAGLDLVFNLADHLKVVSARLENGLLAVDLVREVPEQRSDLANAIDS